MRKSKALNLKSRYEDLWVEAFEEIEKEIVQNKKSFIEAIEAFGKYRHTPKCPKKTIYFSPAIQLNKFQS